MPRSILVVDDNKDACASLKLLLEHFGHAVVCETDPLLAVRRAQEVHPQVVILDIEMPGLNGYSLAKRLRAAPNTKPVRILAISGHGGPDAEGECARAGIDAYFIKPPDIERLFKEIES
jgi:CheY-like chemotaxis protein